MRHNISVQKVEKSRISEVDFNNLPFGKEFSDHMFVADYENGEWKNFRIQPMQNLSLHPSTTALHYGQLIFEGLKAQQDSDGTPILFRPHKNAKRFNNSAERMAMPALPEGLFVQALDELLTVDKAWVPTAPNTSLYIRPFMFASESYVGIRPSSKYQFIIFTSPVGAYYSKPVKVYASKVHTRAFPGGTGFAKTAGNYAATLMPAKKIQDKGYDQILWLDGLEHKRLQEIGTMNVFVVIDGKLITPRIEEGTILEGVTRNSVIELATSNGYIVEERDITIDEVIEAHKNSTLQDAFGAGTAATIAHITDIGYGDDNYELPAMEDRKISQQIKTELQAIKQGEAPDKFGWIHKVGSEVLTH